MKRILSLFIVLIVSYINVQGQANDCFSAYPFCSSNQYNFPNATSGSAPNGPSYGCLTTRPRPIWYYMEIGTAGTISILLEQTSQPNGGGTTMDVDFAMWGPFSSLQSGCQAVMSGQYPLQCSYNPSYSETIGLGVFGGDAFGPGGSTPPAAQVGQVYIVLITNFKGGSGYISFNQTGGTGSADCNIVEPCSIDNFTANISACTAPSSTYSVSGTIDVINPPDVGQLIVRDCNGNQSIVATAPFNASSYPYNLSGLSGDGNGCSIEAYFSDQATTCSAILTYTSPFCDGCSISSPGVNVGACQSNGTYDVSGTINFNNPPSTGMLIVTTTCGGSQTFNAPFTSPVNYSMTGLPANGASCNLRAYFSDDATCELIQPFTAPNVVTPTFDPISSCHNATPPVLPATSTNGITGTWSPATINTSAVGSANYTFTPNAGECAGPVTVSITINELPDAQISNPSVLYECLVSPTVQLGGSSSTPGVTYLWTGNSFVSGETTTSPVVDATGVYTMTVTNPATGCTNSVNVTVIGDGNEPDVSIDPTVNISCDDPTITLSANSPTPGATFQWTNNPGIISGGTTLNPTVNQAGTYQITVMATNGCTNSASIVISGSADLPDINSSQPNVISCTTPAVSVNGSSTTPGVTYSWTGPGIVSGQGTGVINVNQAGTYVVTVTNPANNCVNTGSFDVTGNANPPNAAIANPPQINCNNIVVQLSGSSSTAGTTASWTGPGIVSGGNTFTPSVNAPGTYILTVTDPSNNCTSTQQVVVNSIPSVVPATFSDTTICGNTFQIPLGDIVANGNVTWVEQNGNNGTFSNPNILNPVFTGVNGVTHYTLVFTDECGYTGTGRIVMIPAPQITAPSVSCDLTELNIVTQSYDGGVWTVVENPNTPFIEDTTLTFLYGSTLAGGTETTGVIVSHHGTFTLSFSSNDLCPNSTVTLNFPPYLWTQINDTTLCKGVQHTINAWESPYNVTYQWNNGSTGTSLVVNQSGEYSVTVSNECHNYTDTAVITFIMCDIDAPNIISLSSQSGNNLWFVQGEGIADFNCIIVNRWGNLIHEYNNVNGHWDGRDRGGNIVPEGVYFYTIEATTNGGEELKKQGFIHVVH